MSAIETTAQSAPQEKKQSPYRWVAVLCIGLMHAALMGAVACPGAYAGVFMGEWGVSQTLFVQITLISFLTGALFSVPFGMLADRFGVVKILGIGMIIAAIAGICRVFCDAPGTFAGLYASSFFVGMGLAGMNANSVKFLGAWFGDKITTGMTLYVSGAGIGVTGMMAYASAHIDNMRSTWVCCAAILVVATIVWFALARMPKDAEVMKDSYSVSAVKACFSNKILLLVSLVMVLSMASSAAYAGNIPAGLQAKDIDPAAAAAWASFINLAGMPSNWLCGPIADKLQRMKPVFGVMAFGGTLLIMLMWWLPVGAYTLPGMIIAAFIMWGNIGIIKGSVGMIPSIKREHMGTAGGIQTFFQNLSAFIIPSFVLTPLSGGNMVVFFELLGVCVLLAGVVFCFFTPELGLKGKLRQELKSEAGE